MWRSLVGTIVVLSTLVVLVVQAKLMDVSRDIQTVVRAHNDERMNVRPAAADMREMMWDSRLQAQAEQWASRCVYQRPRMDKRIGANLHYQQGHVYNARGVLGLIKKSLGAWTRHKNNFVYSTHCGSACLYVQMIHTKADRVGCAVNTCDNLSTRRTRRVRGTLFVCFYSPFADLMNSFPYVRGRPCSRCAWGEACVGDALCSRDGDAPLSKIRLPQTTRRPITPRPRPRPPRRSQNNMMSRDEVMDVIDATNNLRRERGLNPLVWDSYLERYCLHVINCTVDYPGPRHSYTNFHRLRYTESPSSAMSTWRRSSSVMPARTEHKCRTPFDIEECNHYSNLMQTTTTGMACVTKTCDWNSRQMVCIYDNREDRDYSRSRRRRRRRRRHHRHHNNHQQQGQL